MQGRQGRVNVIDACFGCTGVIQERHFQWIEQARSGLSLLTMPMYKREFLEPNTKLSAWEVLVRMVALHSRKDEAERSPLASRRCCATRFSNGGLVRAILRWRSRCHTTLVRNVVIGESGASMLPFGHLGRQQDIGACRPPSSPHRPDLQSATFACSSLPCRCCVASSNASSRCARRCKPRSWAIGTGLPTVMYSIVD